ncbi:MAG: cupin domain-containing protein [Actinobacteria bacterium]|nr:cupin domain-containing protein [Actinomycetota bacterium]
MFFKNSDIKSREVEGGAILKTLAYGGGLLLSEETAPKGSCSPMHNHPEEMVCYCVYGKVQETIGDVTMTMEEGDSWYVPSNVVHGCINLEDSKVISIFHPIRSEYLKFRLKKK